MLYLNPKHQLQLLQIARNYFKIRLGYQTLKQYMLWIKMWCWKTEVQSITLSCESWMFWPFDDGPRVSLHSAEQFDRRLLPHGVGSQGNQEVRHLGDVIQILWPLRHHVPNLEKIKRIKRLCRTGCMSKPKTTGKDKMQAVNVSLDWCFHISYKS